MYWKDQIVIEPIKENTGDMFIVNCARVSHNKWKTEFDEKDQGLLNFLARSEPPHKTPFRHARHCFRIPHHQLWFLDHIKDIMVADPFMAAGIVIKDNSIALSVLSMINLINTDHFLPQFVRSNLVKFLVTNYPGVHKAFQLPEMDLRFEVSPLVERKAKDKWLNNLSFRCTSPIWLTRQLVKHQVGLSWNECFSADTEVLTSEGWVLWPSVTEEHLLAVPEKDGSSYSFQKPLQLIQKTYQGLMLHVHSRDLDMLVTPGHDQYVSTYQGAYGPWSPYEKMTTKEAITKKFPKTMQMPQLKLEEGADYWEGKLYGAFIGDGSLSLDGKRIYFHIKKKRKKEMLRELAEATPEFNWNENVQDDGYSYFRLYNIKGWVGGVSTKGIDFYKNTKTFYSGLLHGLMATDGSRSIKSNSVSYSTVSPILFNDLQKLAYILGFDISTNIRKAVGNWQLAYKMTFKLPKPKILKYHEEVDYVGKVYCAETATGLLIVRRNGKSCVSGNCSRRYVSDGVELFNQEFRLRAENVKQGSGEVVHPNCVSSIDISDEHSMDHRLNEQAMLRWYNRCVDPKQDNLAPETIRGYMPLNMMTTWIWSGPQAAFENMIQLREESHAQVEAQVFAQKMKDAILDGQDF